MNGQILFDILGKNQYILVDALYHPGSPGRNVGAFPDDLSNKVLAAENFITEQPQFCLETVIDADADQGFRAHSHTGEGQPEVDLA